MADIELDNLIIRDFKTSAGFQAAVESGEIGENDLNFTPFMPASIPLLTPILLDHEANDMSWLRADTFSWHSGDVYKAAYEHLVNDLYLAYANLGDAVKTDVIGDISITYVLTPDGHKICYSNQESNLIALYEATGVAWYYILNEDNKRFKLPRTKWGFTGLRDSVGGYVAPGLPSIEHTHKVSGYGNNSSGNNSVFVQESGNDYVQLNSTTNTAVSPIYGASDTVQPPATQMHLYFYVGNFEQDAVEQTAGLNAEMFNDLNAHKIIEVQNPTAKNGYTWYRKYADGWVEQGGYNSTVSGAVNITLPIEMLSSVYDIQAHPLIGNNVSDTTTVNRNAAKAYIRIPYNQTTTGFTLPTSADMGQIGTYWQVCGMAA